MRCGGKPMLLLKPATIKKERIMLDSTIELIRAGLKTDPTLSPDERTRILLVFRKHGNQVLSPQSPPQIVAPKVIRRKQAAERLNSSLRFVDLLARQGILKKCVLPGRIRAVGILESSLVGILTTPDMKPAVPTPSAHSTIFAK